MEAMLKELRLARIREIYEDRIDRAATAVDIDLSRTEWFRVWTASSGRDVP